MTPTPLGGLGATLDQVLALCKGDEEATVLIRRAVTGKPWRPKKSSDIVTTLENKPERGNARAYTLDGLGATLDQLRGVCRADPEALDAIDRATEGRQGERTDLGVNHSEVTPKQRDRSGQHLRRLRKDFPGLHAEVLAGELTVHEASVRAGIFPKRVSVSPGCSSGC